MIRHGGADRPSTSSGESWPKISLPPYHYTAAQVGKPCCAAPASAPAAAKPLRASELTSHLASLRESVQRLEDERDIEILQRTYGYYVDKNLWAQAADLFAEDGALEIDGRGVFVGKKRVLQCLQWLREPVNGGCTTTRSCSLWYMYPPTTRRRKAARVRWCSVEISIATAYSAT